MPFNLAKLAAVLMEEEAQRRRQERAGRAGRPRWYKIAHVLPGELAGTLQTYRVRCGKARCRCASRRPEDGHEAAFRVWHEGGRTRKAYVKAGEVEAVRQAIERRAARLAIERARRNAHMRRGMGERKGPADRVKDEQLRAALGSMYGTYRSIQETRRAGDSGA